MTGGQDRGQDVGASKGRKRRGIDYRNREESESSQVTKQGGVVNRPWLRMRRRTGGTVEKK